MKDEYSCKKPLRHQFLDFRWRAFWSDVLEHGSHIGSDGHGNKRIYRDTSSNPRRIPGTNIRPQKILKSIESIKMYEEAVEKLRNLNNIFNRVLSKADTDSSIAKQQEKIDEEWNSIIKAYDEWTVMRFKSDLYEAYLCLELPLDD